MKWVALPLSPLYPVKPTRPLTPFSPLSPFSPAKSSNIDKTINTYYSSTLVCCYTYSLIVLFSFRFYTVMVKINKYFPISCHVRVLYPLIFRRLSQHPYTILFEKKNSTRKPNSNHTFCINDWPFSIFFFLL